MDQCLSSGIVYRFIRVADRNKIGKGQRICVRCPKCESMVVALPGKQCDCGHIQIRELDDKCVVLGGYDQVLLYQKLDNRRRVTGIGMFHTEQKGSLF